jgi:type IV secretion system protein VirB6
MIGYLLNGTDQAVNTFVFAVWDRFQADYLGVLAGLAAIAVALAGYQLWLGTGPLTMSNFGPRMLKIAVPFVIITNLGEGERLVYKLVTDVPNEVAGMMAAALGNDAGSINGSLDKLFLDMMAAVSRIWSKMGWGDVGTGLVGLVIMVVTLIALVPIAVIVLIAKVAVGVLLALAPFALALYFFDATRSLFEGWFRQILGFALTPVMLYSLLGILTSMIANIAGPVVAVGATGAENTPLPSFGTVAPYAFVMTAVGVLALQTLGWASGIAGALALSVGTALGLPGEAARAAQAGLRGASQRPDAEARSGKGAAARKWVAQAALTSRAFLSGAARHSAGMRPSRYADPSHRPRPSSAAKYRPAPSKPSDSKEVS